jgi:DNA-binding XRE family transcriptional regulator
MQLTPLRNVARYATIRNMKNPITQYRAENSLTLEALGERLGVNKTTVMRWEEGRISAERAIEIESATGIPKSKLRPDLFGRTA